MKYIKNFKELDKVNEDNIYSLPDNIYFSISEKQLADLIKKIDNKIYGILDKEGKSTKSKALSDSISDTIKTYLKKYC